MGFGMHTRKLSLMIVAALLLPMLLVTVVPASSSAAELSDEVAWIKATLDKTSLASSSVSVAVDSEGYVHASYYAEATGNLMYVTNMDGTWTTYVVDSASGRGTYNAIAIDQNDRPWIVYYDSVDKDLRYARMSASGSWEKGLIDSTGDVGRNCDIAFDSNGNAGVSYYDTNEKLKFAMYDDGSFKTEEVTDMNPSSTSISFYSNGDPVITYLDETLFLKYTVKSNGTWTKNTVSDVPAGQVSSSTVNDDDVLMVAFIETSTSGLVFAHADHGSDTWTYVRPDNGTFVSSSVSISCDGDSAYITYYATTSTNMKLAVYDGNTFTVETIDSEGDAGVRNAVAANEYGRISVIYIEGSSQYLKYMTNDGARWTMDSILTDTVNVTLQNDMVIDSEGVTHIVFYDLVDNILYYADDSTGQFVAQVIDSGDTAMNPSLAVDSNGYAYISYYDSDDQHLRFATNKNGGFATSIVDSSDGVGQQSAITVNSTGTIVIVYTQDVQKNLKYVIGKGGDWQTITTLDTSNNVNTDAEIGIAIDSSNIIHVSYYRNSNLYYTTMTSGSWSPLTLVDDEGQFGYGSSVACAEDGTVYVSYCSISSYKGVKLATYVNGEWEKEWVVKSDSTSVGQMNDVALGKNDQPIVAYSGPDDGTIMFAMWYGDLWETTKLSAGYFTSEVSVAVDAAGCAHVLAYDGLVINMRLVLYTQVLAPGACTLTATAGEDSVTLNWNVPVQNDEAPIEGYVIYRGTSSSNMEPIATVVAGATYYNDTSVDGDTIYYYSIKAYNSEGASDLSVPLSVHTLEKDEGSSVDMTLLAIVVVIVVAVIAVTFVVLSKRRR